MTDTTSTAFTGPTEVLGASSIMWRAALARAVRGIGVRSVYQPLVDLQQARIVGFEALARFDGPIAAPPDRWFQAAREHDLEPALEVAALDATLAHRRTLPSSCFLSINLSPHSLTDERVRARLAAEPDLRGIVIEITEHSPIWSYEELVGLLEPLRQRGATVAVDDAGAGYAGLGHILELRPDVVKLDRSLITNVDGDEAKRALIESVSSFAASIGAQVLAEGIETSSELRTLRRLGIPLGQGYALGRPGEPWPPLERTARSVLTSETAQLQADGRELIGTLRSIVETAHWFHHHAPPPLGALPPGPVVVVDEHGRAGGLAHPGVDRWQVRTIETVPVDLPIATAARRAMVRAADVRFDPLVCVESDGRLIGLVRIERLVEWLAAEATGAAPITVPGAR